jgi:type IV pilus assembly protein PilB
VKAAPGHLVLSTLHTNDAPSSVNRLVNMGIEPFLVANSINLIAAQRLFAASATTARSRTTHRGASAEGGIARVRAAERRPWPRLRPLRGHGLQGRLGLFEIMEVTEGMRDLIIHSAPIKDIREMAVDEGMSPLRRSGMLKVRDGVTTMEEVARETM